MTPPHTTIVCDGGPHDGRTFTYGQPLPKAIVIADDRLRYHEYFQQPHNVYEWKRSYRIPKDELEQQDSCEILAW